MKAGKTSSMTLKILLGLLFLALPAWSATVKISQEPTTNTVHSGDIFLVDCNNGDGTYTTKTVSLANLGLSGQSTTYVTNLYVSLQYVTNLYVTTNFVSQEYVTNEFVTTSFVTNLTVTQVFQGNKITVTNVTIMSPGGFTNLNLLPNSVVMTDPNDEEISVTNGNAYQSLMGTIPPSFQFLSAQSFWYGPVGGTGIPVSQGTNFVLDFNGPPYQTLPLTNNANFLYVTNTTGASQNWAGTLSVKIVPSGADRTLLFPTNWTFLRTNFLTLSPPYWVATLTNASQGNGPRVGWLSLANHAFSFGTNTASNTNTLALFQESP